MSSFAFNTRKNGGEGRDLSVLFLSSLSDSHPSDTQLASPLLISNQVAAHISDLCQQFLRSLAMLSDIRTGLPATHSLI